MPNYDYRCQKCGNIDEVFHGIDEVPRQKCSVCVGKMAKMISRVNVSFKNTLTARALKDQHVRETDMRQDLRENHMVEKVAATAGRPLEAVYNEIKGQGDFVRDRMQSETEINARKTRNKQREWARKANRRVEKRTIEKQERKKAEEAEKRKIVLSK